MPCWGLRTPGCGRALTPVFLDSVTFGKSCHVLGCYHGDPFLTSGSFPGARDLPSSFSQVSPPPHPPYWNFLNIVFLDLPFPQKTGALSSFLLGSTNPPGTREQTGPACKSGTSRGKIQGRKTPIHIQMNHTSCTKLPVYFCLPFL